MVAPIARGVLFLLGVFLLLLSPKLAEAQPHAYDQYTVDDGLPSNYIYRLAEDELGYLWAATENGLARFDGYEWKSYGLADGLTGLDIYSMTILSSGEIICGGNGMQPMLISKGMVRPFKLVADTLQEVSYYITNSYPPLVSIITDATVFSNTVHYCEVFRSDSIIQQVKPISLDSMLWIPSHFDGDSFSVKMRENHLIDLFPMLFTILRVY